MSGYHQVGIREEDVSQTAFHTRLGRFQLKLLGVGPTNAPAKFQILLNAVFAPLLNVYVVIYLNDVYITRRTLEEHFHHLK
jgi:hypothetical protein